MPQIWEYRYTVVGNGRFPIDMLRYSWSRPASSADSAEITASLEVFRPDMFEVELISITPPENSEGRWRSFGWIFKKAPERFKASL